MKQTKTPTRKLIRVVEEISFNDSLPKKTISKLYLENGQYITVWASMIINKGV